MAESQLTPASTYPAQLYSHSFARELPTDARFIQCNYQKYPPSSSVSSDTISFDLPKFESASIYQIQRQVMELSKYSFRTGTYFRKELHEYLHCLVSIWEGDSCFEKSFY